MQARRDRSWISVQALKRLIYHLVHGDMNEYVVIFRLGSNTTSKSEALSEFSCRAVTTHS